MQTRSWFVPAASFAGAISGVLPAPAAFAHTDTDHVAVPAGSAATVTFAPEHGCGESATIRVRVQAPVEGAIAGDVAGWTSSATPDGAGHTVLEWSGGRTPADEEGSFPVEFTVPDAVGTLLAFPAVQGCENGEELPWIGTAPGDPYPAPQLLVLSAGSEPAATLDDVPADAPGRDQLVALAAAEVTEEVPPPTAAAVAPPTTSAPATTAAPATSATPTTAAAPTSTVAPTTGVPAPTVSAASTTPPTSSAGGDDGSSTGVIVAVIAGALGIGAVAAVLIARRRGGGPPPDE